MNPLIDLLLIRHEEAGGYSGTSLCRSGLLLVVAFLHGSVFPQVVERLQLSGHILPPTDHLPDLLRVLHIFVFRERRSQAVPEVVATFRILPSEVEELWSRREENEEIKSSEVINTISRALI